jgi:hypothetical protein
MSVYKIVAKVNPTAAIIRLLTDYPDGMNIVSIKNETGVGLIRIRELVSALLDSGQAKEMKVGKSRVIYLG